MTLPLLRNAAGFMVGFGQPSFCLVVSLPCGFFEIMAVKPENRFIHGVHKHLSETLYRVKLNTPYTGGIPDCYYSGDKSELWIEYKYIATLPVRTPTKPDLSGLQKHWLRGRHAEGRNVAVIVGHERDGIILRVDRMEDDITAAGFWEHMMSQRDIAKWIMAQTTKG